MISWLICILVKIGLIAMEIWLKLKSYTVYQNRHLVANPNVTKC